MGCLPKHALTGNQTPYLLVYGTPLHPLSHAAGAVNFITVWLNRRHLGSHACFCSQSALVSHAMSPLADSPVLVREQEGKPDNGSVLTPLEVSLAPQSLGPL